MNASTIALLATVEGLRLQSDEVAEGHTEATCGLADEVTLLLKSFPFGGEASFLLVNGLARPVRYPDLRHPATGVTVFCY